MPPIAKLLCPLSLLFLLLHDLMNVMLCCCVVNDGFNADSVDVAASVNQLHGCTYEARAGTPAGIITCSPLLVSV